MEKWIDFFRQALTAEGSTTLGRINLTFGVVAAVLVLLLWTGHAIESIGEFILRLLGKQGRPQDKKDKLVAIISVLVFFVISLFIVGSAKR